MSDDSINQIRILPVNFNGIFQDAINALLGREAGMIVLPQKVSCETICPVNANERPDVLLFDLDNCPHGQHECLLSMRSSHPKAHILILAGAFDLPLFRAAIGAGAYGVVLKADPATTLVEAIHQVSRGQLWLSYEIASQMMADTETAPRPVEREVKVEKGARLTLREREVLALICEGYKDQEVADRIGIRMPTVRAHLASIYLKLDIRDRLNLVIYSYRHGLATSPTSAPINAGREFHEEHMGKEPRARLYVAAKKFA
jgi:DNA-binding NarL/FixJ family response regulator